MQGQKQGRRNIRKEGMPKKMKRRKKCKRGKESRKVGRTGRKEMRNKGRTK